MVTITLQGALGEAMGRKVWNLFVDSVAEGIRAIECQTKKLYSYLMAKNDSGVEYRVLINGEDHRSMGDLMLIRDLQTVEIVPVVAGSAGLWQTILGVVLIIVGIILYAYGGALAVKIGVALLLAGISTTLGGISQMLTKQPTLASNPRLSRGFSDEKSKEEDPSKKKASYLFTGAANTTRQGGVVPVCYGRLIVGSQLISFGITTAKITYSYGDVPTPADGSPFYDLPFWDALEASPFAQDVLSIGQIRRYNRTKTWEVADEFSLRSNGHDRATVDALKSRLYWLCNLFNFRHQTTGRQVRLLYEWLGLTELDPIPKRQRRFEDYVTALVHFYMPGTPV